MRRLAGAFLAAVVLLPADAPRAAGRVVSIGGAVTEIAYALGAGDALVAVDSTSTFPPEAGKLPDVGYMRALSAEPIAALRPDLVLAVEGSGPAAALRQIGQAGLRLELIDEEPGVDAVLTRIGRVAALLDREQEGERLAAKVAGELERAGALVARATGRPRVLFVLGAGRGAPQAAGQDTAAARIIGLAGGVNAIEGYDGYKPLSAEAAVAAAPDVILAMDATVEALGGAAPMLDLPELRQTPAARAGRLVAMDGLLLLGFGPRTGQAVESLARALHPELGDQG
ncbi:ABC transporter substrate-binding protein [Geminicoccaceae bacterium 1502E]|nr:ABC transporter substrate-binding protein [Geminicoccaceae bacterium 1502E]